MRTLRLHGPGDLRLHEEPVPVPSAGKKLLHVTTVGICGSDLHWFHEAGIGDDHLERPLILGHDFAALTENGQRVAVDPAIPCGVCEYCIRGDPNLCQNLYFAGQGDQDGGLRERIVWPERCLVPLTEALSDADGAMLEPLGIAIHAVDLAHLGVGMAVGVFGSGPIGLLIMQLARLAGVSTIIATDVLPHRVEAARTFGADEAHLVIPGQANPAMATFGKQGLDVVFEAAGENSAVEMAIAAARPGGKVIVVGIPSDDRTSFSASIPRRKGLTIKLVRRMKLTYPRAVQLVESGKVNVRSLVTHSFPLDEYGEAFNVASRREGLKVMITL
ncbi:MAG TPA: zinc-binding dehydrogenase [Anaerolineales bacterium]|nr:zinc-binding dehydrogenase [Anaerolineales bacterium]